VEGFGIRDELMLLVQVGFKTPFPRFLARL